MTVVAIFLIDKVGRRPLLMASAGGMVVAHLGLAIAFRMTPVPGGLIVGLMLLCVASFAVGLGPGVWVVLSEIFPTRIRGRALSVATFCLWVANFIVSQTFPMMEDNAWLVAHFNRAFPFYVYSTFCVVLVLLVWRLVPETKGRSLEEIERSWTAPQ